jgi:ABC-2 type transport system permease protein
MALWTLYRKELGSYFISPVAYIVLAATTFFYGLIFAMMVNAFVAQNVKQATVSQAFFGSAFFWFPLIAMVPILTMRLFSEEFKLGTMEMLLTAPVREWDLVLAKFFGAVSFYVLIWAGFSLNFVFLHFLGQDRPTVFWGPTLLPYLGVFLFGIFYTSIGVFASSLTKNQIISAILAFGGILLSFMFGLLSFFPQLDSVTRDLVSYGSALDQMQTFSSGIFDTRPVVFYLSGTVFFLFLTQRFLQARRLRS